MSASDDDLEEMLLAEERSNAYQSQLLSQLVPYQHSQTLDHQPLVDIDRKCKNDCGEHEKETFSRKEIDLLKAKISELEKKNVQQQDVHDKQMSAIRRRAEEDTKDLKKQITCLKEETSYKKMEIHRSTTSPTANRRSISAASTQSPVVLVPHVSPIRQNILSQDSERIIFPITRTNRKVPAPLSLTSDEEFFHQLQPLDRALSVFLFHKFATDAVARDCFKILALRLSPLSAGEDVTDLCLRALELLAKRNVLDSNIVRIVSSAINADNATIPKFIEETQLRPALTDGDVEGMFKLASSIRLTCICRCSSSSPVSACPTLPYLSKVCCLAGCINDNRLVRDFLHFFRLNVTSTVSKHSASSTAMDVSSASWSCPMYVHCIFLKVFVRLTSLVCEDRREQSINQMKQLLDVLLFADYKRLANEDLIWLMWRDLLLSAAQQLIDNFDTFKVHHVLLSVVNTSNRKSISTL